jgi:hypothetical protein
MATRQDERTADPDMNPQDLWLEEIFTDRRVGTIRRMTPVDAEGARDAAREVLYIGETQVMMQQLGALPINFVLEAKSLGEAAKMFGPAAKAAIERTVKELQELRRQQASSIVVPQGGLPPMGPGGGLPGGGKIQMP